MGRRARIDVLIEILTEALNGISKTKIMYRCNLSWRPLQEILRFLMERDLIKEIRQNNHKCYVLTEKGRNVLSSLEKIMYTFYPPRKKEQYMSNLAPLIPMQYHHSV